MTKQAYCDDPFFHKWKRRQQKQQWSGKKVDGPGEFNEVHCKWTNEWMKKSPAIELGVRHKKRTLKKVEVASSVAVATTTKKSLRFGF